MTIVSISPVFSTRDLDQRGCVLTTLTTSKSDAVAAIIEVHLDRDAENNVPSSSVRLIHERCRTSVHTIIDEPGEEHIFKFQGDLNA